MLFPGAGKKLEMEETELAERLREHIWLTSGYLPAQLSGALGWQRHWAVGLGLLYYVLGDIAAWKQEL